MQTGTVTLNDGTSPQFTNFQGLPNNYADVHLQRPGRPGPAGRVRSPTRATRAKGNNQRVRLILIDPNGKFAAHSLPQGVGNFGNVDVSRPGRGHLDRRASSASWPRTTAPTATVPWRVATQKFASFGSVSPAAVLAGARPEQDGHGVHDARPSSPGRRGRLDRVQLDSASAAPRTIPVTLRSMVDVGPRRRVQRRADRRQRPAARRGPGGLLRVPGRPRRAQHHRQRVAHQRRQRPRRRLPGQPGRRRARLRPEQHQRHAGPRR